MTKHNERASRLTGSVVQSGKNPSRGYRDGGRRSFSGKWIPPVLPDGLCTPVKKSNEYRMVVEVKPPRAVYAKHYHKVVDVLKALRASTNGQGVLTRPMGEIMGRAGVRPSDLTKIRQILEKKGLIRFENGPRSKVHIEMGRVEIQPDLTVYVLDQTLL